MKLIRGNIFLWLAVLPTVSFGQVFISEYIEGSSSNKALEVYNAGPDAVDLSTLVLERYNNGALTATDSYLLSNSGLATLPAGDVFVVGNPSADNEIQSVSDDTGTITFFNGDDAIVLKQDGVIVDVIGVVEIDPGAGWAVGAGATNNHTLVRLPGVCQGGTDWGDVSTEWDVYPSDTFDELGTHATFGCEPNEVDLSVVKTDEQDIFIAGQPITYTITVTNNGPLDVIGASVEDVLPMSLSNASWECVPEAGASCTAAGTGNIDDSVDLAAGTSVTYVLSVSTDPQFVGVIENTATVTVPVDLTDTDLDNNSSTDRSATDLIFQDRLEDGTVLLREER